MNWLGGFVAFILGIAFGIMMVLLAGAFLMASKNKEEK